MTKGVGLAEVRAIGAMTAVGRIGQALAATKEAPSGLRQSSRKLIRNLTVAGLLLASAQILLGWLWDGRTFFESLLSGIALAMAILPEEIPVILTVFLALGAWRIAKQKVLTRRVSAVEALGAITVLAVDKTGTLTRNRMQVAELATAGEVFRDKAQEPARGVSRTGRVCDAGHARRSLRSDGKGDSNYRPSLARRHRARARRAHPGVPVRPLSRTSWR